MSFVELIFMVSLSVAFICSTIIAFYVYVHNDTHYRKGFSTWQMPMLIAILAEYFIL